MLKQKYRKSRHIPLSELEKQLDQSVKEEREREIRKRVLCQLMYSDESIEKLAVKAFAAGLVNYLQYEELQYSNYYLHKKGWFGHTTDEELTKKKIRKLTLER